MKLDEYKCLIENFLDADYETFPFVESPPKKKALLLGHDIDLDVQLSQDIAILENQMGVKSTYFFMLRSLSYNLLAEENINAVLQIKDQGHYISLHFDPALYVNFKAGLENELKIFQELFGVLPECISIHRPTDYFLKYDSPIGKIRHTYQSIYCKSIKYFSDSQAKFRYGNPLQSKEFTDKYSIHLLIHPIYWVIDGTDPVSILENYSTVRINHFKDYLAATIKDYRRKV